MRRALNTFVLDPDGASLHATASRFAMQAYAFRIASRARRIAAMALSLVQAEAELVRLRQKLQAVRAERRREERRAGRH